MGEKDVCFDKFISFIFLPALSREDLPVSRRPPLSSEPYLPSIKVSTMRDHIFAASLKASAYLHSWRPTAYLLLLICSCSAQYDTDAVISDYLTTDPGGGTTGSCYNCDGVNKCAYI